MRLRSRVGAAALVAAVTLLTIGFGSPAVNAQGIGSIELVAQSSWIDDGGIFNAQVRVAGADPDSTVVVRVFSPWLERDDFLRQEYGVEPPLLELEPIVLSERQETSNEVLPIELEVVGSSSPARIDPDTTTDDPDDPAAESPLPQLVTDGGSAVYLSLIHI